MLYGRCFICGRAVEVPGKAVCRRCERNAMHYGIVSGEKRAHSVTEYNTHFTKRIVYRLKSINDKSLFSFCAHHMAVKLMLDDIDCDGYYITYPPVRDNEHHKFDHSEALAKALSRELFKDESRVLKLVCRKNNSTKQKTLKSFDRVNNAATSYYINPESVVPERVIIVDDVITTGATTNVIKSLLLENGAKNVITCTFAATGRWY